MNKTANFQTGFTLVEILVSIVIITIVFGVVLTSSAAIQKSSRDTKRQSDLRSIQSALQNFYADQNSFPTGPLPSPGSALSATSRVYLTSLPSDPLSPTTGYEYQAIPSSCSQSGPTYCTNYCIYANLENPPNNFTMPSVCTIYTAAPTGFYKFAVTPL